MDDYPQAFLESMRTLLGGEYPAFYGALREAPVRALRINPSKPGADFGADIVSWEPDGRYVDTAFRPGEDPLHFAGAYYMQDASAMAPSRVLDARPGERVLDLCAAPGGKSGQLAAAMRGQGILVANEIETARAKALSGNLERLGVMNALVTSMTPDELAERWPEAFDAILADAPCSGEGMFRRDPGARDQWSPGSPQGCAQRQSAILLQAAKLLAPGGRLCYSTCTFNEVENEGVVRGFLEAHPEFAPLGFALSGVGPSQEGMLRLWPHKVRGEGQFVALLGKRGANAESVWRREPLPPDFEMLVRAVPGPWPQQLRDYHIRMRGATLTAVPPMMPDTRGIRVLRAGLALCQCGRGYVKPDHALAMALPPADVERKLDLDEAQALAFLCGHELPCPGALSGWTLVCHRGLALGWGKAVSGRLKNHIPKGLRLHG